MSNTAQEVSPLPENTQAQDYAEETAKWYLRGAEKGFHLAQNSIGLCYYTGDGVEKNEQRAAYWFRCAAEQGLAAAQFNLGWLYEHGEGVPLNIFQASHWYTLAAKQGYRKAQERLRALASTKTE